MVTQNVAESHKVEAGYRRGFLLWALALGEVTWIKTGCWPTMELYVKEHSYCKEAKTLS